MRIKSILCVLALSLCFIGYDANGQATGQAQQPSGKQLRSPDVVFVPTPYEAVDAMLKVAKVGNGDVVFDLGSGDGRIPIMAVQKYNATRAVGIDINPERIREAEANLKAAGVRRGQVRSWLLSSITLASGIRFDLSKNPAGVTGRDQAKSQQSRHISATGSCFLALARQFPWQIRPRKLHPILAVHTFHLLARLRGTGLDTKLAFDLLGERQAANCNGFRPESTFREFPNFEVLRFVSLKAI